MYDCQALSLVFWGFRIGCFGVCWEKGQNEVSSYVPLSSEVLTSSSKIKEMFINIVSLSLYEVLHSQKEICMKTFQHVIMTGRGAIYFQPLATSCTYSASFLYCWLLHWRFVFWPKFWQFLHDKLPLHCAGQCIECQESIHTVYA